MHSHTEGLIEIKNNYKKHIKIYTDETSCNRN